MMKKLTLLFFSCALLSLSCGGDAVDKSDPLASARGFIEATLNGDYNKAEEYLLEDSTNTQYFEGLKSFNLDLSPQVREGYREAAIIIDSTDKVNDSVEIIYYYNTYKKEPLQLKIVEYQGEWLVDFKYTFLDKPIP